MTDRERRGQRKLQLFEAEGKSRTRDRGGGGYLHDRLIFVDLYILSTQLTIHESRDGSSGGSKVIYTMRA